MKNLRIIITLLSIISPLMTEAKGPLPDFNQDSDSYVCSDGTFSLDIEFGADVSAPTRTWPYQKTYILKSYGLYGPRLVGSHYQSLVTVTDESTRVYSGEKYQSYIAELKATLKLKNIEFSSLPNNPIFKLGVHGTLTFDSGKVYHFDCD